MTAPRILCVIGVARTGSGLLIDTLAQFDRFFVRGEIFHPVAGVKDTENLRVDIPRLAAMSGMDAGDVDGLTAWARTNPNVVLDALLADGQGRSLAFKIFPAHLEPAQLELLFARRDIAFLFLLRRPIDSYISVVKAQSLKAWRNADTSDVRIRADVRGFVEKCRVWSRWYATARTLVARHGHASGDILYDADLRRADRPLRVASAVRAIGLDPGAFDPEIATRSRQDNEMDYARKVENWSEFKAALDAAGLSAMAFDERGMDRTLAPARPDIRAGMTRPALGNFRG